MDSAAETPESELKAMKRRCWWSGCSNMAFLIDLTGYKYCFSHWWMHLISPDRKQLNQKWFYIKYTKIF